MIGGTVKKLIIVSGEKERVYAELLSSLIVLKDDDIENGKVVGIKDGAFELCGDYEQKREYPIKPEQVIAVAKGFYRKEKYIDCNSFLYKLYTFFWMNTIAIRPVILMLLGKSADIKDERISKWK